MTSNDAFGIDPTLEPDFQGLGAGDEVELPNEPTKKPAGIPLVAWIGIGVLVFVVVGIIITAVTLRMQRNKASLMAEQDRTGVEQSAAEMGAAQATKAEIDALRAALNGLQEGQNRLRDQMADLSRTQDSGLSRRVAAVEGGLSGLTKDINLVAKRIADARPLEADMFMRSDARLLSIGNGVARIADETGQERSVQRGDRFKGLIVQDIRTDRRQVILSDGSVIL